MRAIGDFRLVGFFKFVGLNVRFSPFSLETNLKKSKLFEDRIYGKKIWSSKFAENDSKYYSPLCIFISVLAVVIYWNLK